jgi:hypothetical protein
MKRIVLPLLLAWLASSGQASGYFTVGWKNGKAWFLAPDGKPFLSMGVNAIGDGAWRAPNPDFYNPIPNQHGGDPEAWFRSVDKRLAAWGFNTMGAWCHPDLYRRKTPYCIILHLSPGEGTTRLDAVFSDAFAAVVKAKARAAEKTRNDPLLIGYFLDNEIPWWGEYGWKDPSQKTLLEKYALWGSDDPNKRALQAFFVDQYQGRISDFNATWATRLPSFEALDAPITLIPKTRRQRADALAWTGRVADRFFEVCVRAVKEADPNHLVMGVRFAGENPWEVVSACGKWCDVVSVNHYDKSGNIDRQLLDNYYVRTMKPILITEYSFRAMENQSGDPNTKGADVTVATQEDRAEHLSRYARQALDLPYCVGLHWFSWADESPKGRFDGEDSNYGLVDIHDRPYDLLTRAHRELNHQAVRLHSRAASPRPVSFIGPREPSLRTRSDGSKPGPGRFFEPRENSAVHPWGDAGSGGRIVPALSRDRLCLSYTTGTGWGCGATLPAPERLMDLSGHGIAEIRARFPRGLNCAFFVGESGNSEPGKASYDSQLGADGESWEFPALTGTGKWETYRIDLQELQKRNVWGNQRGNDILDLQAVSNVDFYIPGNQGEGVLEVKDVVFR